MMLLKKFLNKSFSKLAPNSTITNSQVANVLQTAAMTQDFLENTTKKLGNKPNADIIFKRIKECDIETFKLAFIFILEFMMKQVKQKYNKREWIIAIDTHYEPFYGNSRGLWIHGYKPKGCKDCNGSYCYITIAIVIGQEQFTLMASPVMLGQNKADMVEELIAVAKKNLKIKLVLLDRGFDSGAVTRRIKQMGIKHIIFCRRNDKIKEFLEKTPAFSHRYFYDLIEWAEDKSTQREPTKYLIIKDYVDLRTFKIYDWAFIINLSNVDAISYVYLYKRRWCIENTYKQFNAFKIKTASVDFIVRYFFFLFRVLLYNLWKFYNAVMNTASTFKEFVFMLFLSTVDIDHVSKCKEMVNKFVNKLHYPIEQSIFVCLKQHTNIFLITNFL